MADQLTDILITGETGSSPELLAKLNDTVELLHFWQNEACTYRLLAEAVATERYTPAQAKRALAGAGFGPEKLEFAFVPLSAGEFRAFAAIAAFAGLEPREFLWACLDNIMMHSDDEDLIAGCAGAARRRCRDGVEPDWGK